MQTSAATTTTYATYTGVWRTGMSTLPVAPPVKYVLGYQTRTRIINPNPNPITDPNPNHNPKNGKKTTPE